MDTSLCSTVCLQCLPVRYAVNEGNFTGITALMRAAEKDHGSCFDGLMLAGSDVNLRDKNGCPALIYAAKEGNSSIIWRLTLWRAEVNVVGDGVTALIHAAMVGHGECVWALIQQS